MTRRTLIALPLAALIPAKDPHMEFYDRMERDLAEWKEYCRIENEKDRATLREWQREQDEWDAEIERDFAPGGPGEAWLERMMADMRAGKFTEWEQAKRELGI
jgi:hypothetical protein